MQTKIIPVIHYADDDQAMRNAAVAHAAGCAGVFLIQMDGRNGIIIPVAKAIKKAFPDMLVGTNFLGLDPSLAVASNIEEGLDMTWTDEQITHSDLERYVVAERVRDAAAKSPDHLVFAAVAFKYQRSEPNPTDAAKRAVSYGFIPTTSGPGTGMAADAGRISLMRRDLGNEAPLAIASGIDPENATLFAPLLSHILVATGVSSSFHEFDAEKLRSLCEISS